MSNETRIQINNTLLVFALSVGGGALITWGTLINGQAQLKETLQQIRIEMRQDHERLISHEEKLLGLERRVSAVERKTGLAGQAAGESQWVDMERRTNDNF